MREYDKMSFHAEDVEVIRRYAASRHLTFVEAMHGIAAIIEKVMREKRPLRTGDFSMPLDLPMRDCAEKTEDWIVRPSRQRKLFSTDSLSFRKLSNGS